THHYSHVDEADKHESLLYTSEASRALTRLEREQANLRRSIVQRVQLNSINYHDLYSRVLLALRAPHTHIRNHIAQLRRTGAPWALALASLREASVAARQQQDKTAIANLRHAITVFESADMALYAAAARCRLGELIGGDEGAVLRSQGRQFMVDGTVRNPE